MPRTTTKTTEAKKRIKAITGWQFFLLHVESGDNVQQVGRKINKQTSYYIYLLKDFLEVYGLVSVEKKGRDMILHLTKQGKKWKDMLEELMAHDVP